MLLANSKSLFVSSKGTEMLFKANKNVKVHRVAHKVLYIPKQEGS